MRLNDAMDSMMNPRQVENRNAKRGWVGVQMRITGRNASNLQRSANREQSISKANHVDNLIRDE